MAFEGQRIAGEPPDGIGVVFQQDASFPWLSVADNIGFGLARRRVPGPEIARRVADAVRLMGLSGFENEFPAALSGGMRQRVCIARTLVLEPRLILLVVTIVTTVNLLVHGYEKRLRRRRGIA